MAPKTDSRLPGLDLLRACAILLVLFSHWLSHFSSWFSLGIPGTIDVAGDIGVEIFFALSGFLIGRILLGLIRNGASWADFRLFMIRRMLRTLPLYFLWLALLLSVFPPKQDMLVTSLRFLTLTQNLLSGMPPDYYFVVTWSLTIEEWFYLLFAGLLFTLARRRGMRAFPVCLALFIIVPLALRIWHNERGPLVIFRIDEIAYGVLAAWLFARGSRLFQYPRATLAVGLGLLLVSLAEALPLPARLITPLTSNIEVIGAALCLPAALCLRTMPAWLGTPIRWIASRSYALYLIHLTILVDVAEEGMLTHGLLSGLSCMLLAVVVPFVLAELSWRFLEAPMLLVRPDQLAGGMVKTRFRKAPKSLFDVARTASSRPIG